MFPGSLDLSRFFSVYSAFSSHRVFQGPSSFPSFPRVFRVLSSLFFFECSMVVFLSFLCILVLAILSSKFSAPVRSPMKGTLLGSTRKHRTGWALRSKSRLGHARQPLARNHCSGVLRSHLALEIVAQAGFLAFEAPETTAPALFFCTFRSQSLLRCARQPHRHSKVP